MNETKQKDLTQKYRGAVEKIRQTLKLDKMRFRPKGADPMRRSRFADQRSACITGREAEAAKAALLRGEIEMP